MASHHASARYLGSQLERDAFIHDLIAERDALRNAAADAWDEGFKQGGPMHDESLDDPDAHRRNPYRNGDA